MHYSDAEKLPSTGMSGPTICGFQFSRTVSKRS